MENTRQTQKAWSQYSCVIDNSQYNSFSHYSIHHCSHHSIIPSNIITRFLFCLKGILREVFKLGKRKVLSESDLKELVMPQQGELLGRVIKLVGGYNIIVKCTDGKVRTCRIRGKIKRRMWIREHDLVLIAPWDFQTQKADIVWRYISAHAEKLQKDGHLEGI